MSSRSVPRQAGAVGRRVTSHVSGLRTNAAFRNVIPTPKSRPGFWGGGTSHTSPCRTNSRSSHFQPAKADLAHFGCSTKQPSCTYHPPRSAGWVICKSVAICDHAKCEGFLHPLERCMAPSAIASPSGVGMTMRKA